MSGGELAGRAALVTGASRRIGRAIALALADAGADVAINARTDRAGADAVAREVVARGGRAAVVMADVADPAAVDAMVSRTVETLGGLDILVNNAAVRRRDALPDLTVERWREVVGIILDGAFYCSRAAAPHLGQRGHGRIINIGGVTAHAGAEGHAHVVAAKAGLAGLTRALALDLAPVTVNCLSPGLIEADDDDPVRRAERRRRWPVEAIPIGRIGTPADVAGAVVTLAGDRFAYMTGQTVHLNGGIHLT